jgi:hypothetical protein
MKSKYYFSSSTISPKNSQLIESTGLAETKSRVERRGMLPLRPETERLVF